jgi:dihydrofolate synthase/folylpolyglutamate synthase
MPKEFSHIKDVERYLFTLPKFSMVGAKAANFSLKKVKNFLLELGNPHKNFPTIHVAGTNGKGTVCHLLEATYRRAGYKTGLFTSPHLISFNERFRILGKPISDKKLVAFFAQVSSLLDTYKLTYFELSTVIAFTLFDHEFVDVAIIETGLGGRLDATNVLLPLLSVITSISYDHTDILGDDLASIAWEKAGIIKKKVPCIVGKVPDEAFRVIEERAYKQNAPLFEAEQLNPSFSKKNITLSEPNITLKTSFFEPVNAWNVAMIYQSIQCLKDQFPVSEEDFVAAIEEFPGVPGRFERMHPTFPWYFSGSHNLEGITSTIKTIKSFKNKRKVIVMGMMKDKISKEILDQTLGFSDRFFYKLEGDRAASLAGIPSHLHMKAMNDGDVEYMLSELKTSLVIFTGSFYFYPIVKDWMSRM